MSCRRGMSVMLAGAAMAVAAGCSGTDSGKGLKMRYEVQRLAGPITIDAHWDKPAWKKVKPLTVAQHMGDRPEHFPKVQAKLAYDDQAIYVIFRVEDRYVRAAAQKHQDAVCRDSCVEFFFAPGDDVASGYFNLEMNCGGTMLLHDQVVPRKDMKPVSPEDVAKIEVAHSLPRIVDPEIAEPTTWTVEYRLPLEILDDYRPKYTPPGPGVTWRANFFKCADDTSHPHWLVWSTVERPRPDFHVPEYFGTLEFK